MSNNLFVQMPAMGGGLIKNALYGLAATPHRLYRLFAYREVPHFAMYPLLIASVSWSAVLLNDFATKEWTAGFWFGRLFFLVLLGFCIGLYTNFVFKPLYKYVPWFPGAGALRGKLARLLGRSVPGSATVNTAAFSTPSTSGAAIAGETVLRGSRLVNGPALGAELLKAIPGQHRDKVIVWGGVPVMPDKEPEHFLIGGKTGAGKTQAINAMLRVVRHRGQSAIIADPGAGYLARFGREGDIILNPFDSRSIGWSPFAEIRKEYDCMTIAKATIPDANGDASEWNFYAQTMLGSCLKALWKAGEHSTKKLYHLMTVAGVDELRPILEGTPAGLQLQKGGEKALVSIRMIVAAYMAVWEYLPDRGTFSVREWVRGVDSGKGSWLYLTYGDHQLAMLKNIIALWLELAVVEGLTLSESDERRLWYVMDELDSLGKVTSLRAGLTKLRKYGGVCVSGLQTIAQLRDTYGKDGAQILLSCMSTKLVLLLGDNETAKYFEDELGLQETERVEESESESQRPGELASNSTNRSTRREKTPLVLASQITSLPNLHGYLKPVGLPVATVAIDYVKMPNINEPFHEV